MSFCEAIDKNHLSSKKKVSFTEHTGILKDRGMSVVVAFKGKIMEMHVRNSGTN